MDITKLTELLNFMEAVTRRKVIILELYPDKKISQNQLATKIEIAPSNLSKYLSELKKEDILEVKKDQKHGRSINYVQLKPRTTELLDAALKVKISTEKQPLPDLDNFLKTRERLLIPAVQEYAADTIQIISQRYIVPVNSGFFDFLEKHMNDAEIRPKLVVLIKSARNIVEDYSLEDKERVMGLLGSKLHAQVETGNSALKRETINLLKELGAYNKTYEELKDLYLELRHTDNYPDFLRSLILRDYRDKLIDLRVTMMDIYESATEPEKRWLDQEFSLLR